MAASQQGTQVGNPSESAKWRAERKPNERKQFRYASLYACTFVNTYIPHIYIIYGKVCAPRWLPSRVTGVPMLTNDVHI